MPFEARTDSLEVNEREREDRVEKLVGANSVVVMKTGELKQLNLTDRMLCI